MGMDQSAASPEVLTLKEQFLFSKGNFCSLFGKVGNLLGQGHPEDGGVG